MNGLAKKRKRVLCFWMRVPLELFEKVGRSSVRFFLVSEAWAVWVSRVRTKEG